MFTGIVEEVGKVDSISMLDNNLHIWLKANFVNELKVDQSIAHNGVCLTVSQIKNGIYEVVAVKESLEKSNLGKLKEGDHVNLERCMKLNARLDGHMVQGHVDCVAELISIEDSKGSFNFRFKLPDKVKLIVEKGSVCVNGASLTCFDVDDQHFTVTIIPYTYENTTLRQLVLGEKVNIEFDIIGKYVSRLLSEHR